MATPTKKDSGFDPAKLQAMVEPLSVRIDKIKGQNQKMPIELPPKGGAAPGSDWTRDEVAKLENWLLMEWTGGGFYHAIVVDSQGNRMEWEFVYDPKLYPERPAPNTSGAIPLPTGIPLPQAQPAQPPSPYTVNFPPMASTQPGYAPGYAQPQPQPQAQPQPQPQPPWITGPWNAGQWNAGPWASPQPQQIVGYSPYGQPIYGTPPTGMPGMPGMPGGMFGMPPFGMGLPRATSLDEGRRRRWEDEDEKIVVERKRLEDEIRKLERERMEADHKVAIERVQAEHSRQLEALRQEVRGTSETKTTAESEALRRERDERERLERERERERTDQRFKELQDAILKSSERHSGDDEPKRMIEDQNRRHEDEMRRLRDEQQRDRDRIEAVQREERIRQEMKEQAARTEAALREASSNKTDPVIALMQENSRQGAETSREIARMQQSQMQTMAQMMMPPTSVAALLRDNNSGADMLMKNVVGSYSGIFDTFRHAVEQITQLQGGGQESLGGRLAQEAIGRVGEIADRYIGMQRDKVVSEAKSNAVAAQAQAQASVMIAQAQAQTAQASRPPQARTVPPPAPTPPAPPVGPSNGNGKPTTLDGVSVPGNGKPVPVVTKPAPGEPIVRTDDGANDPTTGQTVAATSSPGGKQSQQAQAVTEEQMFGLALESTRKLRKAVKDYLTANPDNTLADGSIRVKPENKRAKGADGKPIGMSAEDAIDAVLKGVNYVVQNNVEVPVFVLFQQGRFADFMDCMLPIADFPQWFRDECVRILTTDLEVAEVKGSGSGSGDAGDGTEVDDDDPQVEV